MRLFTAIGIPHEQKQMIYGVSCEIGKALSHGRMVRSENYHVTLEFLGDVPAEKVNII